MVYKLPTTESIFGQSMREDIVNFTRGVISKLLLDLQDCKLVLKGINLGYPQFLTNRIVYSPSSEVTVIKNNPLSKSETFRPC